MRSAILFVTFVGLVACFKPVREPDCLLDGTCECKQKSDCSGGRDCVNGFCRLFVDAGLPGDLGWPCTQDSECVFGPCLPKGPGNGQVCSAVCGADGGFLCGRGWECKKSSTGAGSLCVPPFKALCNVCRTDSDCNAAGDLCLSLDGGSFCGQDCTTVACRPGYSCRAVAVDAGVLHQCVPDTGSCTCNPNSVGLTRSCSTSATLGTCFGVETCQPNGTFDACNAKVASPEICNGVDDDCNGLTDSADPGLDTSRVPGFPDCRKGVSCTGKWSCGPSADGGFAFLCSAPDPVEERCNGVDDDCNGTVDDGLRDGTGRYASPRACGGCNTDCYVALAGLDVDGGPGAAACVDQAGQLTCVPRRCAKGFHLFPSTTNPDRCEPVADTQCAPCSSNADCRVPGDVCAPVGNDQGSSCQQSCAPTSPRLGCTGVVGTQDCCPIGNVCQSQSGALVCVPATGSCECATSRQGFSRSCFVSSGATTCVGRQVCEQTGMYSVCDTSMTTAELCDGADNDCDAIVDDGFVDTRDSGTYDSDEHCGNCSTNCKARWSPSLQHAIGGCRVDGGVGCAIVQCTTDPIIGGGVACRTDGECGPSSVCDPLTALCVRPCSAGCRGGEVCLDSFCTRGCSSDGQCRAGGNPESTCQTLDGGVRACAVSAQFNDTDRDETNGCECPKVGSGVDDPDVSSTYPAAGERYVDRDCDGVDGVAVGSIFVWAQSPVSQGTRAAPYRTISEALAAVAPTRSTILVAQGSYVEQVVLRPGVRLFGGYSPDFTRRDVITFPTLIEAPQPDFTSPSHRRGTINAEWVASSAQLTVVAGFTVRGYDVTSRPAPGAAGFNSYAVYVNVPGGLELRNNHLVGGRGGDATPGVPGPAGANGGNGVDGLAARECSTVDCANERQSGGAGGQNTTCPATTAGNAGGGVDPQRDPQDYGNGGGLNGQGGSNGRYDNTFGMQFNLCKYDCVVPPSGLNGGPASNGGQGTSAAGGLGCATALGVLMAGDWAAGVGGGGQDGSSGRGGGGGGGGGCVENTNGPMCTQGRRVGDLGATGGGGGSGGCGGSGGRGAASGGGSFALFVVAGSPLVAGNLIDLGFGGNGGNGGAGGYGGLGGQGGRGGVQNSAAWCAGQGGPGGRGGNGGGGSGGGAGCGGSVFGVAGRFNAASLTNNTFAPAPMNAAGAGGVGGSSPAGPLFKGGDGAPGLVQQTGAF